LLVTKVIEMGAAPARTVGHYRLRKKLFRDDTGTMYLARHVDLGRDFTVKLFTVPDSAVGDTWGEVHSRFLKEAKAAGRLRHPNILPVWDAGELEGYLYIVMDHIPGNRLDSYTDTDNLLPLPAVLRVGQQLAAALDYAHRQGIVHRDVKPLNVIYDRSGRGAVLTGFGIARILDSSLTRTGTVRGSPSYMPPEQVMGKKVTFAADVYSLGVTLYQLCTGWLPFIGTSITDLMGQIVSTEPRRILDVRADLPSTLVAIVEKAMAKDPLARFGSAAEMSQALDGCR